MKSLPKIHDPVFTPKPLKTFDKFILRFIRDERDLPFIYLIIKISFVLLPLAFLIYMPFITGWAWWFLVILFQVFNTIYRAPFGLMMHAISHRKLFKKKHENLIYYITWFIGPFIGHTPETYFSHHIGMHHPEGNMPDDDSSTMYYQRDSLRSFGLYVIKFVFTGLHGLITYLRSKKRNKLANKALTGELAFFTFCIIMCFINWQATVAVFIFTFALSRVLMMLGNWVQHAFVDPLNPEDPYKSCITCLNIRFNHIAWNDGYHTSHHALQTLHYTEHPHAFLNDLDNYAKNKAVVFTGLDYLGIFVNLMRKRYDVLASHFVNINDTFANDEEIVQLLRSRTQKFSPDQLIFQQSLASTPH
jgi:fatty acid desaturase